MGCGLVNTFGQRRFHLCAGMKRAGALIDAIVASAGLRDIGSDARKTHH
jgi:hypothetical protein